MMEGFRTFRKLRILISFFIKPHYPLKIQAKHTAT
jgi:hypothetical protein